MGLLTIRINVPADEQESSIMNATLQGCGENHVTSIAVFLPDHYQDFTDEELQVSLREDFKSLTDIGYEIEIAIGPEDLGTPQKSHSERSPTNG